MTGKIELRFTRRAGAATATARQILTAALKAPRPVTVECEDHDRAISFRYTLYDVRRKIQGASVLQLTVNGSTIIIGRPAEETMVVDLGGSE